jgi:hypothetical protein
MYDDGFDNIHTQRHHQHQHHNTTINKQLREPVDVFVSHDWPQWITRHGDAAALFRRKPYFRDEARCLGGYRGD